MKIFRIQYLIGENKMGYESKIFIVNRCSDDYSEIIAEYNLCKMGDNFYSAIPKLFENEFINKI